MKAARPRAMVLFQDNDDILPHDRLLVKTKSVAHRRNLTACLKKCYVFETMEDAELAAVVDAFSKKGIPAPDSVIEQGQVGTAFYVVHEGSFRTVMDGVEMSIYNPGDFFGELALLHSTVRDMGVNAAENPCSVWTIDRSTFRKTLALYHRSKREKYMKIFSKVPMLSKLKRGELLSLAESVRVVNYSAGQRIAKAGEQMNSFFMVKSGKVRSMPGGDEYEEGQYFGEMALLGGHVVDFDINAVSASTLLAIDVDTFDSLLGPYLKLLEGHYNMAVLAEVPSLSKLTPPELRRLNSVLVSERYLENTVLVEQGQVLNKLVFIVSGWCTMIGPGVAGKDKRDPYKQIEEPWEPNQRILKPGDFFGQLALLSEETCRYSVTVGDESVETMSLSRNDVTVLFGPLHRLNIQREETTPPPNPDRFDDDPIDPRPLEGRQHWTIRQLPDIAFEDLRAIALTRSGTFGDTRIVIHKPMGAVYGLKSFSRAQLTKLGTESLPMREKAAMSVVDKHPFILELFNTYKNSKKLYMLTEMPLGGELFQRIYPPLGGEPGLKEPEAMFYVASVITAIGYMHSREVVYRNLSPESILIDTDGYIKLTDLETAKLVMQGEMTHTLCGTVSYMSPEMLLGKGHREGTDWWSLGVLIYEMLLGRTPFEDMPLQREEVIMKNIIRHNLELPVTLNGTVGNLITGLLDHETSSRLGCQLEGVLDVQNHAWFTEAKMDFLALTSKTVIPPFVPVLNSISDYSHYPNAETIR